MTMATLNWSKTRQRERMQRAGTASAYYVPNVVRRPQRAANVPKPELRAMLVAALARPCRAFRAHV